MQEYGIETMTDADMHHNFDIGDGPERVAVVLNSNAKKVNPKLFRTLKESVPPNCDIFFTESVEQADFVVRRIVDDGYDTLITGGGDGTVLHTIDTTLQRVEEKGHHKTPKFGILKLGTGNAIAAFVGSNSPKEDLTEVHAATVRPLDLFSANGHRTTFGGYGWDAHILRDYDNLKKHLGDNPIAARFLKTLAGYFAVAFGKTVPKLIMKPPTQKVRVVNHGQRAYQLDPEGNVINEFGPGAVLFDGVTQVGSFGTIPYFGYRMKILPFADLKPGYLHLRLMNIGPLAATRSMRSVWNGQLKHPGLTDLLISQASLEFDAPTPMHLSGDYFDGIDHLNISIAEPINCLRFND